MQKVKPEDMFHTGAQIVNTRIVELSIMFNMEQFIHDCANSLTDDEIYSLRHMDIYDQYYLESSKVTFERMM